MRSVGYQRSLIVAVSWWVGVLLIPLGFPELSVPAQARAESQVQTQLQARPGSPGEPLSEQGVAEAQAGETAAGGPPTTASAAAPEFDVYRGSIAADEADQIRFDLPLPGFLLVEVVPVHDPQRVPVLVFEPLAGELFEESAVETGSEAVSLEARDLTVRSSGSANQPETCAGEAAACGSVGGLRGRHLLAVAVGAAGSYQLTVSEESPEEALGVFKLMARFVAEEVAAELTMDRGEPVIPVDPEALRIALETGALGRLVLGGVIAERPALIPGGEGGPDDTPLVEIPDSNDPDWSGDVFTVTIVQPSDERPGFGTTIARDVLDGLPTERRNVRTPVIDGEAPDLFALLCPSTQIDPHGDLQLCASRLTVDEPVGARIENSFADDVDVFEFRLNGRAAVRIQGGGDVDLVGSLFDARGDRLAFDDDSGAERGFLIDETLAAGVYRLRLQAADGGEGDYQVLVETSEPQLEEESNSSLGDPGGGSSPEPSPETPPGSDPEPGPESLPELGSKAGPESGLNGDPGSLAAVGAVPVEGGLPSATRAVELGEEVPEY